MSLEVRSNGVCELCGNSEGLSAIELPISDSSEEQSLYICSNCKSQIESGDLDENHFNCLNDAMWSETSAVKIMSYILFNRLGRQDMIDTMYLEEDELKLAEQTVNAEANKLVYKDSNGVELQAGDSIVISVLPKGRSFGEMSILDNFPRSATAKARIPLDIVNEFRKSQGCLQKRRKKPKPVHLRISVLIRGNNDGSFRSRHGCMIVGK